MDDCTAFSGQGFPEVFPGSLCKVKYAAIAWGDYDNDGDLDILLTGQDTTNASVSKIYQNTGNGFTEVFAGTLIGVYNGSVAWGDYDNDNDLDILLTGTTTNNGYVSKIYQNTGDGFIEVFAGSLTGVGNSSGAWGDIDNDGDLDVLLTGAYGGGQISKIYRNTGNGFTEVFAGSLTPISSGSVAFGDYDNDGDLDIILTGFNSSFVPITKLYHNTGNGFTEIFAGSFEGVRSGSVAWGDYDNDGDLDILLTGINSNSSVVSKIYQNTGSGFTEIFAGSIIGCGSGSAQWGDNDNDGDLDILITGITNGSGYVSKMYQNTGNGFTEVFPGTLQGTRFGYALWGDYDNDGDLDILVAGLLNSNNNSAKIYKNTGTTFNTVPATPTGLTGTRTGANSVSFKWNRATDGQTASAALTYNLSIVSSLQSAIMSPMANFETGYRYVARLGNTNQDTSWTVNNLDITQTYYWQVQAVDNAFAGGEFSNQATFSFTTATLPVAITKSDTIKANRFKTLSFSATGAENATFTFSLATEPAHGILSALDSVNGTVLYTPTPTFTGLDSFSYRAFDGALYSEPAVFTILVPYDSTYFRTVNVDTMLSKKPVALKFNKKLKHYPIPNVATIRDTVVKRAGTMRIGIAQQKATAKLYAWMEWKKGADIGKFYTSAHTGRSYPWDSLRIAGKKRTKLSKAIKPDRKKFNNPLAAELGVLKLNIVGSSYGVFPFNFGELVVNVAGTPYNGKPLGVLSLLADTMMTYWNQDSTLRDSSKAEELKNLIKSINDGFARPIVDSVSDIVKTTPLTLRGKVSVSDVPVVARNNKQAVNWESDFKGMNIPEGFLLEQNYPNPFNPLTVIGYSLSVNSIVSLKVYDVLGREVVTLVNNETMNAGEYEISFNASSLSSGVYFYRLTAKNETGKVFTQAKKLVLMK